LSDFEYIGGVRVVVDDVVYMPSLHSPLDKPHPFLYYITVYNNSDRTIQIFGRKWIVTESDGETLVVEGNGVIGETPTLEPGESFSYNSYHVVAKSAEADGALYGISKNSAGELQAKRFLVAIPEFKLQCPNQG